MAAVLATMGVVVFAYDMFGFGESAYHAGIQAHLTSLAQSVQTWSSLRAIDFISSLVENAHFADEGHDYGFSKRNAAYRFFASHWGLDLQLITDADGKIDETGYTFLPAEKLAVFPDKKLPEGALRTMEEIYVALCVKR